MQRVPAYANAVTKLGDTLSVPEDLITELESFTCAMYGRNKVNDVNSVCHIQIKEICAKQDRVMPTKNVDISSFPPCRRSLVQHIKRANYQAHIWKQAHVANPDIPDPEGHGWVLVDGKLEPL